MVRFIKDVVKSGANAMYLVPSGAEIACVLEIIDKITTPALNKVEELLQTTPTWDNAARNDFCR